MKFTKMHGIGNDYIFVDAMKEKYTDEQFSMLSIILSRYHFGIGSDGIITISESNNADYFMQIYNSDGSKGEMCGNGIRCVGKYLYDNKYIDRDEVSIETLAGIKYLKLNIENNLVKSVVVDMGIPKTHNNEDLDINKVRHNLLINNRNFEVMDISMGNPHTVIFVDEFGSLLKEYGSLIENNEYYKNRTNVEFVKEKDNGVLDVQVWERGSGITLACGTGACASATAYMMKNPNITEVIVNLPGGTLKIKKDMNNHIFMEGPATKVFDGDIDTNQLILDYNSSLKR